MSMISESKLVNGSIFTECRLSENFYSKMCQTQVFSDIIFTVLFIDTPGGLVGISDAHPVSLSRGSIGGDGSAMENGHGSTRARVRAVMPKNWEVAYSDSGEPFYIE
jgi:hypothetical protein